MKSTKGTRSLRKKMNKRKESIGGEQIHREQEYMLTATKTINRHISKDMSWL